MLAFVNVGVGPRVAREKRLPGCPWRELSLGGAEDVRWTEEGLRALPMKNGFRLRGLEMTRLEVFTDAAFAFAISMLVISLSGIPKSYGDLLLALKGAPAFAASFATIASFWHNHRQWSRRFGLEDGPATVTSLLLVFVMLVFVYPLKMVFSALFAWLTQGWLPSTFVLEQNADLPGLFVVYGFAFCALTGLLALLHWRALAVGAELRLSRVERLGTRGEIVSFALMAATGLLSALFAALTPTHLGVWAGFAYLLLPLVMPIIAIHFSRRVEALQREG